MSSICYRSRRSRNRVWLIVLVCLVGLELGGNFGLHISQFETFNWAGIALEVGTENPWTINTSLHDISILFRTRFNLGSLFGLLMALSIYSLVRRR
jgi:hypothetical protein